MIDMTYDFWRFLVKWFLITYGLIPWWMYEYVNIISDGIDLAKRGGGRG